MGDQNRTETRTKFNATSLLMKVFALLCLLGCLSLASAHCPNMCSGHGSCGTDDVCTCYNGFTFPDCSARLCRESTAWFARTDLKEAEAHETTHGYGVWDRTVVPHSLETECSNAGLCDRKTGQCKCFNGWTGTGCERLLCPGGMNCNGHGTCETIREQNVITRAHDHDSHSDSTGAWTTGTDASDDGGSYYDLDRSHAYTTTGNDGTYYDLDYSSSMLDSVDARTTKWDADKIVGCNCDFGWSNYDCSYKLCPRGDDPIYIVSTLEKNEFSVGNGDKAFIGTYQFKYYGKDTDGIVFEGSETNVQMEERISEVLHRHPYIKDVTVEVVKAADATTVTKTANGVAVFSSAPTCVSGDSSKRCENLFARYIDTCTTLATGNTASCVDRCEADTDEAGTACTFTAGTAETVDQCAALTISVTFNQIHSQIYLIDGSEEDDTGFNPRDMTISANNLEEAGTGAAAGVSAGGHVQGSYQHQECSLRGMCDSSTGICKCFEGYTGDACEVQSSLAY